MTPSITDPDLLHAYIDGVVSCAYIDVISNVTTCVWNKVNFVDDSGLMKRAIGQIASTLATLNHLLAKSSTPFYYDQPEPTIADYFVFEAYTIARDFDSRILPKEEDRLALMKLEKTMRERPALVNYFSKGLLFKRFSGLANESEYMATLAAGRK